MRVTILTGCGMAVEMGDRSVGAGKWNVCRSPMRSVSDLGRFVDSPVKSSAQRELLACWFLLST
jgi:hypothetical protein